jgi:hypothetical protein
MKRVALAICLLTAIAAGTFLASHRPGAQASPDGTCLRSSRASVGSQCPQAGRIVNQGVLVR